MSAYIRNIIITAFLLVPVPATGGTDVWTITGPPGENIYSLAVAPGAPETIYAGGPGVYESTDSGSTWVQSGLTEHVGHKIVIQPSNSSILYATAGGGIWKSMDSGANWSFLTIPAVLGNSIVRMAVDPVNPNILYAVGLDKLHKSIDSGSNWTAILSNANNYYSVALDPKTPTTVYSGCYAQVYKSSDGGSTWPIILDTGGENVFDLVVHPSDSNTIIAAAGGIYKSTDGGINWTQRVDPMKFSVRKLKVDEGTPDILYGLNHYGSILRSADRGSTWKILTNSGLASTDIEALGVSPSTGRVFIGTLGDGVAWMDVVSGGVDIGTRDSDSGDGGGGCFIETAAMFFMSSKN